MKRPRVLVLCGQRPRHLYVANALCREAEVVAIVHETGRQWTWKKVKRMLRPRFVLRKILRRLRERGSTQGDEERRFFFEDGPATLDHPELKVEVPYINHPDVVALSDREDPDVIAVFGTTLIRKPLLGRGRHGMVNLHGGLSPHYRGADCAFWALYNGEPDQVGCTLHFINAGIDTGKLIAHVCPAVTPEDDASTLFWRSVRDSAEVYGELVQRLASGEELGQAQTEKGTLYQVKDKTGEKEAELAERLAGGLLEGVSLPPRVTWF